ncbi:MAG: AMP-binding protein [Nocardioides sp.]
MPPVRDPLLRSGEAPAPRTLVDVFRGTVEQAGEDSAIDAGTDRLTYAELESAADDLAAELHAAGVGPGDRVGVRIRSGTTDLYVTARAALGRLRA